MANTASYLDSLQRIEKELADDILSSMRSLVDGDGFTHKSAEQIVRDAVRNILSTS